MKLIKAHIVGFGKLQGVDINFSDGINSIFHENGYGKTTLSVFLKAMFFGMAKKGNNKAYAAERSKFAPWSGGNYGGSLTFEESGKTYTITRLFGGTPEGDTFFLIDEKTGLASEDYSKDIGQEIFGVGVETFEITAFFSQEGLEGGVNDEVRANLTGANKFENDLSSCSQAQKIISQAISKIKAQTPKAAEIEENKKHIIEVENLIEYNQNEIISLQERFSTLSQKCEEVEKEDKARQKQYQEELALSQKAKFLKEQLDQANQSLAEQQTQKEELLKGLQQTEKEEKTPKKFSKIFIIIPVLFLVGLGFIIASFFSLQQVFVPLGVVFMLLTISVLMFGFMRTKRSQQSGQTQINQNIANQLKITEIDKNISLLQQQIFSLQQEYGKISKYQDAELPDFYPKAVEFEKNKNLLSIQIENLKRETEQDQQRLEIMQTNLDNLISLHDQCLKKQFLLEKTKDLLLAAQNNVSSRYLAPMQEAFDKMYKLLGGEEDISLNVNLSVSRVTDRGLKESEYLSVGYRDLLSICRRFILLDQVYLKSKPFVVLDDPFVNLDDKKLELALELVRQYSSRYQIIYICSHSRCKI